MEYSTDSSLSFEELFGGVEYNPKTEYGYIYGIDSEAVQSGVPRTYAEIVGHENIACSISGGADSDIMLDIVSRLDTEKKVHYVFFDTGIEMRATLKHLDYLEDRYGIKIEHIRHDTPIPIAVKKYGYPFLSKKFSDYINRLQNHGFQWEDGTYKELEKKYPGCQTDLRWWCNEWGENSSANIERAPYLREFMIQNPPTFKISPKCCDYGKKKPADIAAKKYNVDLTLIGLRKAEWGARSMAYKSCLVDGKHGLQHFPLFWFKDEDKQAYEDACGIVHSDAYTVYGCKRTGCAGCPFGSGFEDELKMLEKYEPQLYKAVCNIFGPHTSIREPIVRFEIRRGKKPKKLKKRQREKNLGNFRCLMIEWGHSNA